MFQSNGGDLSVIQSVIQLFGFIVKYSLGERLFLDVILTLFLFNAVFFGKHQRSVQSGVNCSVIKNSGITQALLQQKEKIKILIFFCFELLWLGTLYITVLILQKKNKIKCYVCHLSGTQ